MDNFLYLLFFVIALFLSMQVYVRLSTFLKKGKLIEDIDGSLGQAIDSGQKNLLYFYSNGCAACKPMGPVIDTLKEEFKTVHKINIATDMDIARKFGVMGTPSTILIENRKISSFLVGAKSESVLRKLLFSSS